MSEKPETKCTHLDQIHEVVPSGKGCLECLQMGTPGYTCVCA